MKVPGSISSLSELNQFIKDNGGVFEINSLEIPKDSNLLKKDRWSLGFVDKGYGSRIEKYRGIKVKYK